MNNFFPDIIISPTLEGDTMQMLDTSLAIGGLISALLRPHNKALISINVYSTDCAVYLYLDYQCCYLKYFDMQYFDSSQLTHKVSIRTILECIMGSFKKNRFKPGTRGHYYNTQIIEQLDLLYWKKVEIIKNFMRACRWRRLAKLSKTRAFCEWFYAPQNIGGLIAKKELAVIINE